MKYLILGLGFIATHIAEHLSKNNDNEVTVTYKNLNPVKELYVKILKEKKVNVIKLDPLNEKEKLKEEIAKNDTIVNLIGEIQGNYDSLKLANVTIPELIAKISSENKKMLIHFSGLLGITGKDVKPENPHLSNVKPVTDFEKTKFEGEKAVYDTCKANNSPVAIIRPTLVYGKYSAHIQFITMYKFAKRGIIPKLSFNFNTVSANYIGEMIKVLSESKETTYFYATECDPVNVSQFFELMAKGLNKNNVIKIPVPESLAKIVLPSYIKSLLKYTKSTYNCEKSKELVKNLTFDEKEIIENASFLHSLEENKILIPT
ncbi:NAD-dependent epimerase/dehydratase family protein [Acidianus sulfidivorans JP7]|uniref:NAD-dependent epimerase/dehydratase domain-containing protein n=1 Tax=Acidianus sulfidivorans JP7 TaxID=619593 RepID=A0A2U9IL31_9CREN|nr:saccharopine dehydrogenase NADP-binding domain-containing protein [Acidianus sulfidivorans]AWR96723.1 NAD-dependent epimerase/dehydratase family protein [Acidianus sulfidivorans JP7]